MGTYFGTLDYQEGWLCIREEMMDSLEPKKTVYFWPILQSPLYLFKRQLTDNFIGKPVTRQTYSYEWYSTEFHKAFRLINGGQTQAIKVITEDVPRPKVRPGIEIRWHYGRWEKYLKTKGWTPI